MQKNLLPPNQGGGRTFNSDELDDDLRRDLRKLASPSQAGALVLVLLAPLDATCCHCTAKPLRQLPGWHLSVGPG